VAAARILMHHAKKGERLYSDNLWTCTGCQEKSKSNYVAVVGGFSFFGLYIGYNGFVNDDSGVSAARNMSDSISSLELVEATK